MVLNTNVFLGTWNNQTQDDGGCLTKTVGHRQTHWFRNWSTSFKHCLSYPTFIPEEKQYTYEIIIPRVCLSFQRLYQLNDFHYSLHKYYSTKPIKAVAFSFPTACINNTVEAQICAVARALASLNGVPLNKTCK